MIDINNNQKITLKRLFCVSFTLTAVAAGTLPIASEIVYGCTPVCSSDTLGFEQYKACTRNAMVKKGQAFSEEGLGKEYIDACQAQLDTRIFEELMRTSYSWSFIIEEKIRAFLNFILANTVIIGGVGCFLFFLKLFLVQETRYMKKLVEKPAITPNGHEIQALPELELDNETIDNIKRLMGRTRRGTTYRKPPDI